MTLATAWQKISVMLANACQEKEGRFPTLARPGVWVGVFDVAVGVCVCVCVCLVSRMECVCSCVAKFILMCTLCCSKRPKFASFV